MSPQTTPTHALPHRGGGEKATTPAYAPDEEISTAIDAWHETQLAKAAAAEREEAAFTALNTLVDERLGPGVAAVFVGPIGDPDEGGFEAGKAGRSFPIRGAGTDFQAAAEEVKKQLGAKVYAKYFVPEEQTVHHPNRDALAADRKTNKKLDAILEATTSAGEATLTRVAPAAAGAAMRKNVQPLPDREPRLKVVPKKPARRAQSHPHPNPPPSRGRGSEKKAGAA